MKKKRPCPQKGKFLKTDVPCLYRYSSSGVYFALLKHEGKQKRVSLKTRDKAEARRKLSDERRSLGLVDLSAGHTTLKALCARYLLTIQHQAKATVYRKEHIIQRLLDEFPKGATCLIKNIRQSELEAWVGSYKFGAASYTLYVLLLKELFKTAVNDRILAESPAAKMRCKRAAKPVRVTPTFEEFQAIVASVREQKYNADAEESGDLLEFMGLIGVGQAEAGGIQRQHVNLRKRQLTFFRHKTKTPFTVPIFPQAVGLVTKLAGKRGTPQEQHLFTVKDAKKALAAACQRLGYPAYSQRALRRMFITRCIELGVDVKVISEWQGHRDGGKLILGTYSHVRSTHSDEMAKKLTIEPIPVEEPASTGEEEAAS